MVGGGSGGRGVRGWWCEWEEEGRAVGVVGAWGQRGVWEALVEQGLAGAGSPQKAMPTSPTPRDLNGWDPEKQGG